MAIRIIKESIDLSDCTKVNTIKGYGIYRKKINGKSQWIAQKGNSEPFEITYDQARGFEPINSDDAKFQHATNKALRRESRRLKEGYYALMSYNPGSSESGIDGDKFEIIDVTTAKDETSASRKFGRISDNEYVLEIDKDTYDQFFGESLKTSKRRLKESVDTWERDINEAISIIDNLELPLDEELETVVRKKLSVLQGTVEDLVDGYFSLL